MNIARLNFLAYRHKRFRAVVARDVRADGTRLTLECGHVRTIAPHFDAKHTKEVGCSECGELYVRSSPQYASEFVTNSGETSYA